MTNTGASATDRGVDRRRVSSRDALTVQAGLTVEDANAAPVNDTPNGTVSAGSLAGQLTSGSAATQLTRQHGGPARSIPDLTDVPGQAVNPALPGGTHLTVSANGSRSALTGGLLTGDHPADRGQRADRARDWGQSGQPLTGQSGQSGDWADRRASADPRAVAGGRPVTRMQELRSALTEVDDNDDPLWMKVVDHGLTFALSLIVTAAAAVGQIAFARWAGVERQFAWMAPFLFEFAMVAFLWRGYRRARKNQSPAPMWTIALMIGCLSVFTNVVHSGSFGKGMFFGSASLMCLVLWFAKLYDSYRDYLRKKGKIVTPIPKLGRNWFLSPRRAWRAMLVGTAINSDDVAICLSLAQTWQSTFKTLRLMKGKTRPARSIAKIAAWNSVKRIVGQPEVVLPDIVVPTLRVAPPPPPPAPAPPSLDQKGMPATEGRVVRQQSRPMRPLPEAPTSPAPAGASTTTDPFQRYADVIAAVQQAHPDWATREEAIKADEIGKVSSAIGGPTGQGTLLKIRVVIEALSQRPLPAEVWERNFPNAPYPKQLQEV